MLVDRWLVDGRFMVDWRLTGRLVLAAAGERGTGGARFGDAIVPARTNPVVG